MAVYILNNHGYPKWLPGTFQQITGPASVLVMLRDILSADISMILVLEQHKTLTRSCKWMLI